VEKQLFGVYRPQIERMLGAMRIEKIIDIGPRYLSPPTSVAGVPVVSKGALPAGAVSELLQNARFGLIAYPFDVLGKSGVFAAYAAHGVVPIVFATRRGSFDGLEVGRHFLDGLQPTTMRSHHLDGIQQRLFHWYESHSLSVQVSVIAQAIERLSASDVANT
jgi:hypothetical protein